MTEPQEPTIQQLRAAADEGTKATKKAAELERENAFLKAGINPESDPKLGYFVKGYEGELTTEAIKAAAERDGFLAQASATPPPPEEEEEPVEQTPPVTPEQAAQDALAASVAAGATPPGPPPEKALMDEAWENFSKDRQTGKTQRDAAAHVIQAAVFDGLGIDPRK